MLSIFPGSPGFKPQANSYRSQGLCDRRNPHVEAKRAFTRGLNDQLGNFTRGDRKFLQTVT